ncbi:hypothetical protein D3C83_04940 [compost metagenome]
MQHVGRGIASNPIQPDHPQITERFIQTVGAPVIDDQVEVGVVRDDPPRPGRECTVQRDVDGARNVGRRELRCGPRIDDQCSAAEEHLQSLD